MDRQRAGSQGVVNALRDLSAAVSSTLLVPRHPADLAEHYDLTLSHPAIDCVPFRAFEQWLAQAAARRGLTCALLHDGVVHDAIQRLASGRLTIGFHLDYFALWHVADDPYARLAQAVQDAGGRPVNPPVRSRMFTDKAAAHAELLRHGLGVPPTILIRPWAAERPLTPAERAFLRLDEPGARVYVKPANGFGGRGVVRTESTAPEAIARAVAAVRQHDRHDAILIQREVRCPTLRDDDGVERPAYWRVLWCLGEALPCWWTPEHAPNRPSYRLVTAREIRRCHLEPMLQFVRDLAALSGLEWFSTEVCLSTGNEPSRHVVWETVGWTGRREPPRRWPVVAIDYLNDQCDVDVQSRWPGAPPDVLVRYVAERFAEAAARQRRTPQATPVPLRRAA
ncbi:MAG: hypothetical protein NZ700_03370 [Gemmataceae bacterium]|nr:hypothetical protein [Gemmataceae bacterium]MDW8267090.1 hypothetical protein [Gemmataceae bacterium]